MSCDFCKRPLIAKDRCGMCQLCAVSYDRDQRANDGTIYAAMLWAAKRARYFALKRASTKNRSRP